MKKLFKYAALFLDISFSLQNVWILSVNVAKHGSRIEFSFLQQEMALGMTKVRFGEPLSSKQSHGAKRETC